MSYGLEVTLTSLNSNMIQTGCLINFSSRSFLFHNAYDFKKKYVSKDVEVSRFSQQIVNYLMENNYVAGQS